MGIRIFLVGVFVLNTLFGQICMMPMAHAAMLPNMDEMSAEQMMTPIHSGCEHCPKMQSNSCAGHCLSQASSIAPSAVPSAVYEIPVAISPQFFALSYQPSYFTVVAPTAPPPDRMKTDTIVLRL